MQARDGEEQLLPKRALNLLDSKGDNVEPKAKKRITSGSVKRESRLRSSRGRPWQRMRLRDDKIIAEERA